LLLRKGQLDAALNCFRRTPPQGQMRHAVLLLTGECHYWLKNYPEAEQLFTTLAADRPSESEPHRWLGAVYYDIGLTGSAIFELEKALELNPHDHRPHRLLASIFLDLGRNEKAIHHYQIAIQQASAAVPQNDLLEQLSGAFLKTNQFAEAISTAAKIQPPTVGAMLTIAQAQHQLGELENSQLSLDRVLAADATNPKALLLKGRWLLESGNSAESLPLLENSVQRSPHDVEARYQFARALLLEGYKDSYNEHMMLLQISEGLHKRFSELHDRAWANPDDVAAREEMAEVTRQLGHAEAAEFWTRAAQACRVRRSRCGPVKPMQSDELTKKRKSTDDE
jgi:tetratricopeptide (TPR) repeat protein